ncbi:polysaccharide pyruvyl transferase family protein [Candidatus Sumerlaeota bacterium]|nr:polysaccharide pyruvyl transferase family protein [Candidatus Sumerlaeota bacterium]
MHRAVRPLRARYIGYTKGTMNHGDEALIWIIRELLAPEIEVLTEGDEYDLALLGGGTLINQSPWLIDAFEAALNKAKGGMTLGTGVGDPAFWGDHFERWSALLNRCDFVGVRGPRSVQLLHQRQIEKAICVGDPYLWLRSPVERDPIPRRLGVNLGGTNNSLWGGGKDQEYLEYAAGELSALRRKDWSFIWLSVWEQDLPLLERVRARVDSLSPGVIDVRTQPLEAYAALAGCDVFLGEKLHASAMAAVAGIPFIALEYQPKVVDFAASIEMADCCLSTAIREPGALTDKIEELHGRRDVAQMKMIEARDRLRLELIEFTRAIEKRFC